MVVKQQGVLPWIRLALVFCVAIGLLSLGGCFWLFPEPDLPKPDVIEIVSQTISASEGGTIVVTEEMSLTLAGLELYIPPGALKADEKITIGEVVAGLPPHHEEHVALGYSFSLEPVGLSFRKAATLRLTFRPEIWEPWRNLISTEAVVLMRYDKASRSWVKVPTRFEAGVLTAKIEGFSFWDLVFFWRPSNPASDAKIREQARRWRPVGDVESRLRMKPFLDHEAFRAGDGDVKALNITFADAIGGLLFAEAMWERLSDGNFYAAARYAEVLVKTLAREVLTSFIQKLIGLPSLGTALTAAKVVFETTIKHMLGVLDAAGFNRQLRAYLSWRGWFYEDKKWVYNKTLALDHNAVLTNQYIWSDDGWIRCWQTSSGSWACFGYLPGRPLYADPKDLFRLGNELCDLLHKVHTKSDVCWYPGCPEVNGLEKDKIWLESAFKELNRPPTVRVTAPEGIVSVGTVVTLQGKITDLEDDPLVYRWIRVAGPEAALESSETLSPRFTPKTPGQYVFRLDVWDLLVENSGEATVTITVSGPGQGRPPIAISGQATNVTATSATLNGTVNPNGLETSVYFEWGTSTAYGNRTSSQSIGGGTSNVNVSANLTGLSPDTTYYFRVVGANEAATAYGTSVSFKTSTAPQGNTYLVVREGMPWHKAKQYAESLGGHLVTIRNEAENRLVVDLVRGHGILGSFWIGITDEAEEGNFVWVTGEPVTYTNWGPGNPDNYPWGPEGEDYGEIGWYADNPYLWNDRDGRDSLPFVVEFEGILRPPTATTGKATSITATSATLNAAVNPNGLTTTVYFEWGQTMLYGNKTPSISIGSGTEEVNVSIPLTSLSPDTLYHFRAVAVNSAGKTRGQNSSFRTLATPAASAKILIYVCSTRDDSSSYGTHWYTGPDHLLPLRDLLTREGYSVEVYDQLTLPDLTLEILARYSQVWVLESDADTIGETGSGEATDLYTFYSLGGGVWISLENDLGGDYGNWTEDCVPFVERFGLAYGGSIRGSSDQPVRSSHYVMNGVERLCFDREVGYLKVANPKAEVVWQYRSTNPGGYFPGVVVLDERVEGRGRAVFDSGWVLGYAYWRRADNLAFARNVANWLEGGRGENPSD